MNRIIVFLLLGFLSACSGLDSKSSQLDVGSTKADVLKSMGSPLSQSTQDGVQAWQYGAKVGLGYCEYKDIYFVGNKVIDIGEYYHQSLGGCIAGLQDIDWGPVLAKAKALPQESKQTTQP